MSAARAADASNVDGSPTPAFRIDGAVVGPAEFIAAACDPARSIVIESCAGSGKTWTLVSRIVRALLDGAEPGEILAITFTRKAAAEMRSRLDEWLQDWAAEGDDGPRVQALVERGVDPASALALAPTLRELRQRLLRGGQAVEIRTFHGWFMQLLAQAPLALLRRLGLAPGLALIEDVTDLREDLMRAFHRHVDADAALRADYVALVRRHRRHAVLAWLDAAWVQRTEIARADAAGRIESSVPPAHAVFADVDAGHAPHAAVRRDPLRGELQAVATVLADDSKAVARKAGQALGDALGADDDASAFRAAWTALFTKDGPPRKVVVDHEDGRRACDALHAVRERQRQHEAHEDQQRLVRLARVLLQTYAVLKRERGLADMNDLETVAYELLGDGEAAAWMQTRLDWRIRHLLIDEFQDTSPLQWQALDAWLSGYAGAGGGRAMSVFIVGDPKQSIYRFRRAEPRVFQAARAFVADGLGGSVLECDHTRRSAPEVVATVNRVFGLAARDDGWHGFRPHTGASAEPRGHVWRLDAPPADETQAEGTDGESGWRDSLNTPRADPEQARRWPEARRVAAAIDALLAQGVAAHEVMVLARQRNRLQLVADALAERHLPCTLPEALVLAESAEAQDLVAVLDVLVSPGHALSLARALKSPLFGASDADLLELSTLARTQGGWWTALMSAAPASPALARARELLARWAAEAPTLPAHDLLDRIVHEGEAVERVLQTVPPHRRHAARSAIQCLLDAALAAGSGADATPYRFVRAVRRGTLKARPATAAQGVKLLTIHAAKGLEARWVFLIDADGERRKPMRHAVLVDWPTDRDSPRAVAFLASESEPARSLVPLLDSELAEQDREDLNALYVAMTRAREGLVVSRTLPHRADDRPWWSRLAPHALDWPLAPAADARPVADTVQVPVLPRRRTDGGPAGDDGRAPPAAADAHAAAVGQAVHRLLEWIGQPGRGLPASQWPAAAAQAATSFGVGASADAVLAAARRILGDAQCGALFDPQRLAWAGNEVSLAGHDGELLRIDRLVAMHGEQGLTWWVLDYKLAGDPLAVGEYRTQLARYAAAVQSAQPGDRVRAAFVTADGRLLPLDATG